MKKEYWALLVFVLIIVLQWIGLGFHGQIRFIFLIIILVLLFYLQYYCENSKSDL